MLMPAGMRCDHQESSKTEKDGDSLPAPGPHPHCLVCMYLCVVNMYVHVCMYACVAIFQPDPSYHRLSY